MTRVLTRRSTKVTSQRSSCHIRLKLKHRIRPLSRRSAPLSSTVETTAIKTSKSWTYRPPRCKTKKMAMRRTLSMIERTSQLRATECPNSSPKNLKRSRTVTSDTWIRISRYLRRWSISSARTWYQRSSKRRRDWGTTLLVRQQLAPLMQLSLISPAATKCNLLACSVSWGRFKLKFWFYFNDYRAWGWIEVISRYLQPFVLESQSCSGVEGAPKDETKG